ncbi:hypothetical protein [Flavobacterium rhizosphaerae]|uniref:Uncharacterized protein n=1 Tax=Flavobacterium rhizosphaerae TaxID=3163298 RepID=A0ABW8YTZ5_9FLAO
MSILTKIVKINDVIVIGAFRDEAAIRYAYAEVQKKGNKLTIKALGAFENSEQLAGTLSTNKPVILVLDGKNVLYKKIDYTSEADINWRKNLDFENIYYNQLTYSNCAFISLCRKEKVDDIIKDIQQYKFQIIGLHIGILNTVLLQQIIGNTHITANKTILNFANLELHDVEKLSEDEEESYKIAETHLSNWQLPLYASALAYFINNDKFTGNTERIAEKDEAHYKKAFEYLGVGMMLFFFATLLISYLAIRHYSAENLELNQKTLFSGQSINKIEELARKKSEKMRLLTETGQLSKNFLSFYAYSLFQTVPEGTHLTSLEVFPLADDIKESKKAELIAKTIGVTGTTSGETSFNNWLETIKKLSWIQKFEIISLKKDSKNIQHFELKILVDDV